MSSEHRHLDNIRGVPFLFFVSLTKYRVAVCSVKSMKRVLYNDFFSISANSEMQ